MRRGERRIGCCVVNEEFVVSGPGELQPWQTFPKMSEARKPVGGVKITRESRMEDPVNAYMMGIGSQL